jgi:hypothetical protein
MRQKQFPNRSRARRSYRVPIQMVIMGIIGLLVIALGWIYHG